MLAWKPERTRPIGGCSWEDIIKIDLMEIVRVGEDYINSAQGREQRREFFLTGQWTLSLKKSFEFPDFLNY